MIAQKIQTNLSPGTPTRPKSNYSDKRKPLRSSSTIVNNSNGINILPRNPISIKENMVKREKEIKIDPMSESSKVLSISSDCSSPVFKMSTFVTDNLDSTLVDADRTFTNYTNQNISSTD